MERYFLVDGRYASEDIFNWDESYTSKTFPDLTINLWEVFDRVRSETE
jgi:hypothetical protein